MAKQGMKRPEPDREKLPKNDVKNIPQQTEGVTTSGHKKK